MKRRMRMKRRKKGMRRQKMRKKMKPGGFVLIVHIKMK